MATDPAEFVDGDDYIKMIVGKETGKDVSFCMFGNMDTIYTEVEQLELDAG